MKLLALSDIHGAYDEMFAIASANPSVDAIIVAGDLTTYGSSKEAEEAIRMLQSFNKPVLVVAGNMDPPELDEVFSRLGVSINGTGLVINDAGFCGVSASPVSPLNTPNEISEEEIVARAQTGWKSIRHARFKVFVPHAPPVNTKLDRIHSGRHVGSKSVRTFIEQTQPDVVICGHIHEAQGTDTIGKTQIINCGQASRGYFGLVRLEDEIVIETFD